MFIHLLQSFIALQCWMFFIWGIYLIRKNAVIADVAWSLGIVGVSTYHIYVYPQSLSPFILMCLGLWSLRLSGFIFWTRLKPNHQDSRYERLKKQSPHSSNMHFLINCLFQGFLQWIIAIPFIFKTVSWPYFMIGISCIMLGLLLETLADYQLLHFKRTHPHQVCDVGLWKISRHPNYLGEILLWTGFAISHCSHILALVSPLTLYFIMMRITGPLTEATSIESKGQAYLEYQRHTPMIFPKLNSYKSLFSKRSK